MNYLKYIVFLVETSRKINVDTIYLYPIHSIFSLLKVLLLTSGHDTNDFHVYNSKETIYKS